MTDDSTPKKQLTSKNVPSPSFIKLAMRNMVRKGSQSLKHFGLTAIGFILFILLLAWLGHPTIPG